MSHHYDFIKAVFKCSVDMFLKFLQTRASKPETTDDWSRMDNRGHLEVKCERLLTAAHKFNQQQQFMGREACHHM